MYGLKSVYMYSRLALNQVLSLSYDFHMTLLFNHVIIESGLYYILSNTLESVFIVSWALSWTK